ncbi:MAG: HD domain-containing phosphohydrolase [Rhodospirillaceae bacterium]
MTANHERWDGSGYPRGLRGEDISIEARIVAVADVFDALLSNRPYKVSWGTDDAVDFINEQSCQHFDPAVVRAFNLILPQILQIQTELQDS